MYSLRPAIRADHPAIRRLIHDARINPISLDWRRFVVAVTPKGEIIGCGQVKPHNDGSRELASIAIAPAWQGRGAAGAIIVRLLATHPGTLYLTCHESLESFYEHFGFKTMESSEIPPYFRRLSRLEVILRYLRVLKGEIIFMQRDDR